MSNDSFNYAVVIPVKDRDVELARALDSVNQQTIKPSEVVVVDDGSSEYFFNKISNICAKYACVKLLRNSTNKGAPYSRNRGAENTNAKYIAFLDSDDVWSANKIEIQSKVIKGGARVCYSLFNFVYTSKVIKSKCKEFVRIEDLLVRNVIGGTSSVLVARDLFQYVGGFNVDLKSCQDWDLWLRLAKELKEVYVCQEFLVDYHSQNENRISGNLENFRSGHDYIFSYIEKNGFFGVCNSREIVELQNIRKAQILAKKFGLIKEPLSICFKSLGRCFSKKTVLATAYAMYYLIYSRI